MSLTRREAVMVAGGAAMLGAQAMAQGKGTAGAKTEVKAPVTLTSAPLQEALRECIAAGDVCLDHCFRLLSTGDKSMAECARTVRTMLPLCRAMVELNQLGSEHLKALAAVCAKACRDCEAACKKHANHHAECKACMETCQRCATECEKLAG